MFIPILQIIIAKKIIMSNVKIWVHLIFSTKHRFPYLGSNIRFDVIKHIEANCYKKNIYLKSIGGYTDHLHCLISLGKDQTIADVAQLIKGESSFWINKNKLTASKFMWQDDYYVRSVSESHISKISNYINNQEVHHSKKTFDEELKIVLQEFELVRI